jgi:plasmid stabilization system protein ParE
MLLAIVLLSIATAVGFTRQQDAVNELHDIQRDVAVLDARLCDQSKQYRNLTRDAFQRLADAPGIAPAVRDTLLQLIKRNEGNTAKMRKLCAERRQAKP